MNNWRKLRTLSARERRLLVQSVFLLPAAALMLRVRGFKRCQSALGVEAGTEKNVNVQPPETGEQARSTARMVRLAARRGLYRAGCLPQALVLWWLLKRQGIKSDLCIGVNKSAEKFEAHAWVELDGAALGEAADLYERFTPFKGNQLAHSSDTSLRALRDYL